ncbi:MAG: transcriptional regulator [bacterium]|nr:transcriptional regulator [bacterium]
MNNANLSKIRKITSSFRDDLVEDLKDPIEAQAFLEAMLEGYEKDRDTQLLMLALRDIAVAQGGIGKLAQRTRVSRPHLYEILASKHSPSLDTALDIFSGLGFRVRLESVRAPRPRVRKKKRAVA